MAILPEKALERPTNEDTPLILWDRAAGFQFSDNGGGEGIKLYYQPIYRLLASIGIKYTTCSQNVCLLKRAAFRARFPF